VYAGSVVGTVVVVGAFVVVVVGALVVVVPAVVVVVAAVVVVPAAVVVVAAAVVVVDAAVVVVVAAGWHVGQPLTECVGLAAMTGAAPWHTVHLLILTVAALGAPSWQLEHVAKMLACAGTSCGNSAVFAP
jgi:hypothetical protein